VALITNHFKNGYFIFRPGEGYEYVLFITLTASALGALGGGRVSVDNAVDIVDNIDGWAGLGLSLGLGTVAALGLLAIFWRPEKKEAATA
jgi:putative oxidoreductase